VETGGDLSKLPLRKSMTMQPEETIEDEDQEIPF
jgi:hypothetical protein